MSAIQKTQLSYPAQSVRGMFQQHLIVTQRSPKTIEHYMHAVEDFYHFLNCRNPVLAQSNEIRAYLFHLMNERNYAPRTFNQYLYGLKAFYECFLPDVPIMASFSRQSTPDGNITVISRFEFEGMLQLTDNIKHQAVLVLLYSSGIRAFECAKIRISDFDAEQMLIRVQGKGDKQRYSIFSTRCREQLREYIRQYRPVDYLFPGKNKEHISSEMIGFVVREAARRAKIAKRVSPHILRHSFATAFLEIDGRLPILQSMLGHRHPKTTYRYCHVDTSLLRTVTSPLDVDSRRFGPQPAETGNHKKGGK
jgi:integrase/recombinase XerD